MSSFFNGKKVNVHRICGHIDLLDSEISRSCFVINNATDERKTIVLTTSEAQELVMLLQAALIDWRGEI